MRRDEDYMGSRVIEVAKKTERTTQEKVHGHSKSRERTRTKAGRYKESKKLKGNGYPRREEAES